MIIFDILGYIIVALFFLLIILLLLWVIIGFIKIIFEEVGIIKGGYFGKEESHNEN